MKETFNKEKKKNAKKESLTRHNRSFTFIYRKTNNILYFKKTTTTDL